MPRITNQHYLRTRREVQRLWQEGGHFANLNAHDQLALHAYFAPSKDLDESGLLALRQAISVEYPSLPSQAGKAWARLQRILDGQELPYPLTRPRRRQPVEVGSRRKAHNIIVYGELRPEPDVRRIARAIVTMAVHDAEKEIEEQSGDQRAA